MRDNTRAKMVADSASLKTNILPVMSMDRAQWQTAPGAEKPHRAIIDICQSSILHKKLVGMTASVHAKMLRTPSSRWGAYHVSVDAVCALVEIEFRLPFEPRDEDDATDEE